MRNPQINIQAVSFSYHTVSGKREIFSNLDLKIKRGSFLCITGPSGCGKSTLLKLVAGFEKPDSGLIAVNETPSINPGTDRIMIFQEFDQLLPWLTVTGNLLFPLRRVKRLPKKECLSFARHYLEMTGLLDAAHLYPFQLSGGMKQRAAIARALVLEPAVLLMDEPFGSLDYAMRKDLQELILQISRRTDKTVVFVTHDISEAVYLSDEILMLSGNDNQANLIRNTLPHPRDLNSDDSSDLISRVTRGV